MVYRPQFFILQELVCPHVYNKFGDRAWLLLDEKIIVVIDTIRRMLGKLITVNDWAIGGQFSQRGLRCIQCSLVKEACNKGDVYVSAHILGRAIDFSVKDMNDADVRIWMAYNKDKLPYNIRIEKDTDGWVHIDSFDNGNKITFFTV